MRVNLSYNEFASVPIERLIGNSSAHVNAQGLSKHNVILQLDALSMNPRVEAYKRSGQHSFNDIRSRNATSL
jgi:hypothetical protein